MILENAHGLPDLAEVRMMDDVKDLILRKMEIVLEDINTRSDQDTDLKAAMVIKLLSEAYNNLIDMEDEL